MSQASFKMNDPLTEVTTGSWLTMLSQGPFVRVREAPWLNVIELGPWVEGSSTDQTLSSKFGPERSSSIGMDDDRSLPHAGARSGVLML